MAPKRGRSARLMVSPFRHPKTGVFYFRQAVPAALRGAVGAALGEPEKAPHELKWSLRTKSLAEAKRLMPAALQRATDIMDAARGHAVPLSHREQSALAGLFYHEQISRWERFPEEADEWVEALDVWDASIGPSALLPLFVVRDFLAARNVVPTGDSLSSLHDLFAARLAQALRQHQRHMAGDYRPDKAPEQFPEWKPEERRHGPSTAVTLTTLLDQRRSIGGLKPRTLEATAYAVKSLVEFLGHEDAAKISRQDILGWRDKQKAAGLSNTTVNNNLSLLGKMFAQGAADGLIRDGIMLKTQLPKQAVQSPEPYSDDDAAKILRAARLEKRPSKRWAHWVMAYTGMRAAEVLQLTGNDIREDQGIWYVAINEADATKSVKTGRARNVPLHEALIAEGFLAYAQSIKGDAPLFPDKKLDAHGNRGGKAWQVIGRWVRQTVGITDPRKAPDHSWRHRMEDELRAVDVPEDVRDAILGHARKTTGRHYGVRGESLRRLKVAVDQVPKVALNRGI